MVAPKTAVPKHVRCSLEEKTDPHLRNTYENNLHRGTVFHLPLVPGCHNVVDADRGVTESDFITVAGLILAAVTIARVRRGR